MGGGKYHVYVRIPKQQMHLREQCFLVLLAHMAEGRSWGCMQKYTLISINMYMYIYLYARYLECVRKPRLDDNVHSCTSIHVHVVMMVMMMIMMRTMMIFFFLRRKESLRCDVDQHVIHGVLQALPGKTWPRPEGPSSRPLALRDSFQP